MWPPLHMAHQNYMNFLNNNPSIYFMRGVHANDPYIIGKNDNQVVLTQP